MTLHTGRITRSHGMQSSEPSETQKYFHNVFDESCSSKDFWKHLKHLTGSTKISPVTKILMNGDNISDDPATIADVFNKFFVSVASIYKPGKNNNSTDNHILKSFVAKRLPTDAFEFVIPLICQEQVLAYLNSIEVNKSTGLDGISVNVLRVAAPAIAAPLSKIMNMSIKSSMFPTNWKLARVTPVFKGGDALNVDSYRPISILPIISKVLEKHVHVSLYGYLSEYNLFNVSQSGLIKLIDDLLVNMDKGLLSGITLIDYRKPFDLVDHTSF